MTAEPRTVEEIRADIARQRHREVLARLAAADRENAELRGEVERLHELVRANAHAVLTFERERNSARAQLAAAQAQLAEAPSLWSCPDCAFTFDASHTDADGGYSCPLCGEVAAEARLEAVRALHRSDGYDRPTCLGCGREWPCPTEEAMQAAALSAAPQPEPEVAPYETPEDAAANDAIPAEPISPEFRQRLIAAVERPLRVRRAILLLAGHASGHLPGFDRGCRVCRRDWPCEDTQRAAAPALEAFADVTPEPPAIAKPTGRSD